MNSLTLFDLDAQLAEAESYLLDAGGVITDDVDAALDVLLDARDDKVSAYVALIRNNDATAAAFKAETDRLDARRRAHENSAKRLKERLLASMIARGEAVHETPIGRVRVQHAGRRAVVLRIADAADLPERFRSVRVEADRAALAAAIEAHDPEAEAVAALADPTPYLSIR